MILITTAYNVGFIQNINIKIGIEELTERPKMWDEDSEIHETDDIIEILEKREDGDNEEVLSTLRKLSESGVEWIAIDRVSI